MQNLCYFTCTNIPCALSNLTPYLRKGSTVVDVLDAVEDSDSAPDLLERLQTLLPFADLALDRHNTRYVRIKHTDRCGNVFYLRADF